METTERPPLSAFKLSPVQRLNKREELLEVLKGDKGEKGDKGDRGEMGFEGKRGPRGMDGVDGKDGKDGKDGRDGIDGKDGINGKDGKDGKDGKYYEEKPDSIVEKINKSKNKIKASQVESIEERLAQHREAVNDDLRKNVANIQQRGGPTQLRVKNTGVPVGAIETLNFIGATVTPKGNGLEADVTITAGGTGTVTSVASADASVTITNATTTPDLAVAKSPKLTTGRTIGITGAITYTSPSFDGSANITAASTLSNSVVGIANLSATGTPSSTTYLRGDNTWATVTGGSGVTRSVNVISANTNAGATASTDYVYLVSGTTTLTLPTAVANTNQYTVKNTGSGTVTIATTSAQTIDGGSTATLTASLQGSIDLISDGSNWFVI